MLSLILTVMKPFSETLSGPGQWWFITLTDNERKDNLRSGHSLLQLWEALSGCKLGGEVTGVRSTPLWNTALQVAAPKLLTSTVSTVLPARGGTLKLSRDLPCVSKPTQQQRHLLQKIQGGSSRARITCSWMLCPCSSLGWTWSNEELCLA